MHRVIYLDGEVIKGRVGWWSKLIVSIEVKLAQQLTASLE